ncbi:MAG: hypothetical protein F6K39_30810 [Okeania sp. SIO3B3]|nr:hypothetical protein [Okeania sp. SIO3B3]
MSLKELAQKVASPTICDMMHGEPHAFLMDGPLPQKDKSFFGEAVTLRSLPFRADLAQSIKDKYGAEENHPFGQALEMAADGKVLVIDTSGYTNAAVAGDVKLVRLHDNGAAGLVTDGRVRDKEGVTAYNFGLACSGFTPRVGTGFYLLGAEVNVPVAVGKVLVNPGDFIFGDQNGTVVIPKDKAEEVLTKAAKQGALEDYFRDKISKDNVNPARYYPPNDELRKEFEAWYATNK